MVLSIVLLIIIGLVAYLHWIQGLLSGLISAVLAVLSACMAMSYYESLAQMLSGGKFNDQSQGVCLLAIFALSYLILRIIFDKLVPGNVRVNSTFDKIGGAVCGVVAGLMGAGIVAIAFQSLPVGPSVLGYSRYSVKADQQMSVPAGGEGRNVDRFIYSQLEKDDLGSPSHLLIPVDDLVVGLVSHISNGGSMATGKTWNSLHPDLMQEYFTNRIGVEIGAKHTASNKSGTQVSVERAVQIKGAIPAQWAEYQEIRKSDAPKTVGTEPGMALIAVEVKFSDDAADEDHIVRLAPAAVRLCAKAGEEWKNYFPLGTFENGKAWVNKLDDFLLIKGGHSAWFIYKVDEAVLVAVEKGKEVSFKPGSFIEAKRLAKVDLEHLKLGSVLPRTDEKNTPIRKQKLRPTKPPEIASADSEGPKTTTNNPTNTTPENTNNPPPDNNNPPPADNGWKESPLTKPAVSVSNKLPVAINTESADADAVVASTAVTGETKAKKWDSLDVVSKEAGASFTALPKGGYAVADLLVPPDKRMIQVTLTPKSGVDSWAWLEKFGDYSVVDGGGNAHKASGVYATVMKAGGAKHLLATYKSSGEVAAPPKDEGSVTSVTLIYLLPKDQKAKEIRFEGKEGGLQLEK